MIEPFDPNCETFARDMDSLDSGRWMVEQTPEVEG